MKTMGFKLAWVANRSRHLRVNGSAEPIPGESPEVFRPSAIIPCYNHHTHLSAIVRALREAGLPVAIIDDGSGELTRAVLIRLETSSDGVTVIWHERNKGKGAAVKTGLWWAATSGYTHALQIDADGQHTLSDVGRLIDEAKEFPMALVSGAPVFDESAPFIRRWGRLLSVVLVWVETRSRALRDPLCGFRVYPVASCVKVLTNSKLGDRMDFDAEIAVKLAWHGVPFRSVSTRVRYPAGNTSHFRLVSDNISMVKLHGRLLVGSIFARRRKHDETL